MSGNVYEWAMGIGKANISHESKSLFLWGYDCNLTQNYFLENYGEIIVVQLVNCLNF